jgi:hypothetical protein
MGITDALDYTNGDIIRTIGFFDSWQNRMLLLAFLLLLAFIVLHVIGGGKVRRLEQSVPSSYAERGLVGSLFLLVFAAIPSIILVAFACTYGVNLQYLRNLILEFLLLISPIIFAVLHVWQGSRIKKLQQQLLALQSQPLAQPTQTQYPPPYCQQPQPTQPQQVAPQYPPPTPQSAPQPQPRPRPNIRLDVVNVLASLAIMAICGLWIVLDGGIQIGSGVVLLATLIFGVSALVQIFLKINRQP